MANRHSRLRSVTSAAVTFPISRSALPLYLLIHRQDKPSLLTSIYQLMLLASWLKYLLWQVIISGTQARCFLSHLEHGTISRILFLLPSMDHYVRLGYSLMPQPIVG